VSQTSSRTSIVRSIWSGSAFAGLVFADGGASRFDGLASQWKQSGRPPSQNVVGSASKSQVGSPRKVGAPSGRERMAFACARSEPERKRLRARRSRRMNVAACGFGRATCPNSARTRSSAKRERARWSAYSDFVRRPCSSARESASCLAGVSGGSGRGAAYAAADHAQVASRRISASLVTRMTQGRRTP